jgi:hypothetical protein
MNYAEEHLNRAAKRRFGPPETETMISDWKRTQDLEKNTPLVHAVQRATKRRNFCVYKNEQSCQMKMAMCTKDY